MIMRKSAMAAVALVLVAVAVIIVLSYTHGQGSRAQCLRPQDGFLIIESSNGYNDSVDHSPGTPWPVINVSRGQMVSIVVCNTDVQSHEFEIQHYYNSTAVQTPNQAVLISFVANQTGTFRIYNNNFDSLSAFEQNGELIVSP